MIIMYLYVVDYYVMYEVMDYYVHDLQNSI